MSIKQHLLRRFAYESGTGAALHYRESLYNRFYTRTNLKGLRYANRALAREFVRGFVFHRKSERHLPFRGEAQHVLAYCNALADKAAKRI